MADGPDLTQLFRRTVQANARFYQGWVDLSLEYFRGLTEIFGGAQPDSPAAEAADFPAAGTGVLVVEGEAGTTQGSAFLVTNDLGRNLSCELIATEFAGPGGAALALKTSFEPPRVELAPGEQRVVQATVAVDERLTPGVAYSGAFAIKGMDGFSVPVVVRRRHSVSDDADPARPGRTPGDVPGKQPGEPANPGRKAGRKSGARRR
jgi:hypothetical protein